MIRSLFVLVFADTVYVIAAMKILKLKIETYENTCSYECDLLITSELPDALPIIGDRGEQAGVAVILREREAG